MFTQSCFIRKNSPKLREKLKKLGYYVYDSDMNKDSPAEWCTVIESEAGYAGIWNKEPKNKEKFLDCGENEQLFLALAALRDDTDYKQWFTDGIHWEFYNFNCKMTNDLKRRWENMYSTLDEKFTPHKATPEELIKHFNHE